MTNTSSTARLDSVRSPGYFEAPFHVYRGPGAMTRITIPDGHRLVVFCRGQKPSVVPPDIMPMGDYEMAPEPLPGGSYPIAMQVLPVAQAALASGISVELVERIFDAIEASPVSEGEKL